MMNAVNRRNTLLSAVVAVVSSATTLLGQASTPSEAPAAPSELLQPWLMIAAGALFVGAAWIARRRRSRVDTTVQMPEPFRDPDPPVYFEPQEEVLICEEEKVHS